VPTGDSPDTIKERSSDKLDDKLSDKPEAELAAVVQAWPKLPDAIRSAILMLVRASAGQEKR
jgi:hypothetical protein